MQLVIKNSQLATHFAEEKNSPIAIWRSDNPNGVTEAAAKDWGTDHPETILYQYLHSFLKICEEQEIEFDLTYATVHNLGPGLLALLLSQQESYDFQENLDIIAKTLAAVLSYLAINERGYWFHPLRLFDDDILVIASQLPLWAGTLIMAVEKGEQFTDFLPYAKEAIQFDWNTTPASLKLQFAPVIAEYKELTGDDLSAYGLKDCCCGARME